MNINILVPDDVHYQLKVLSLEKGVSLKQLINDALAETVKKKKVKR